MDETTWNKILDKVMPQSISIAGLLRSVIPLEFDGDKLKLGVCYKFHKDKLEEAKTQKMLDDVTLNILGKNIKIEYQLTEVKKENIMNVAEEMFS